jgi:hypothetical protein
MIEKMMAAEGFKGSNGSPLSAYVIKGMLEKEGQGLEIVAPKDEASRHSFARFHDERIIDVPEFINATTGKPDKSCRLPKAQIVEAYRDWCKAKRIDPMSNYAIGKYLLGKGYKKSFSAEGCTVYKNIGIIGQA